MPSEYFSALRKRYGDSYKIAKVYTGIGAGVKALGVVGGIIAAIAIGAMIMQSSRGARDAGVVALIAGLISGLVVFLIFYVVGVLISSVGELLRATLDTAINSSSLITNDEMAEIMSLKGDKVSSQNPYSQPVSSQPSSAPTREVPAKPISTRCHDCGGKLSQGDIDSGVIICDKHPK